MAGQFCQECGAPNEAVAKHCARCGSELRAGVPPAAPVAPPPYGPVSYAPAPYAAYPYPPAYGPAYPYPGQYPGYLGHAELERQKQVDRTKTGLLLLAVAFLIGWIPVVEVIGLILAVIGVILVILGRKAFGARHATFVVASVILYVVSLIVTAVFLAWFVIATIQVSTGGPRVLLSAFWPFVGGVIGASSLAGVAEVLVVHELEKPVGRYLLYGAFVATIVVPIATVLVLLSTFNGILAGIANGTITNPDDPRLAPLLDASATLALVDAIPSVLFGVAYLLAWRRIERKEIPAAPMAVPGPGAFPAQGAAPQGTLYTAPPEPGPLGAPPEPRPPP